MLTQEENELLCRVEGDARCAEGMGEAGSRVSQVSPFY